MRLQLTGRAAVLATLALALGAGAGGRMSVALADDRVETKTTLMIEPGEGIEYCGVDPGFDVDLYVSCDLRTMTAIWMGLDTVRRAVAERRLLLTGDRKLASAMQTWLGLSPFAKERKLAS